MTPPFTPQVAMPTRPVNIGDVGHLVAHQGLHDAVAEVRSGLSSMGVRGVSTGERLIIGRRQGRAADGSALTTPISAYAGTTIPFPSVAQVAGLDMRTADSITVLAGTPPQWYQLDLSVRTIPATASQSGERNLYVTDQTGANVLAVDGVHPAGASVYPLNGSSKAFLYPGDTLTVGLYATTGCSIEARAQYPADVQFTVTALAPIPVKPIACGYAGGLGADGDDRPGLIRDLAGAWLNRSSWANLRNGDYIQGSPSPLFAWLQKGTNRSKAADIGVGLIPHDQPASTWNALLDEAIAGTHDADYTSMGGNLATYGPDTVFCRIWWEMNINAAAIDPVRFKAAWNRAVPLIRSGFAAKARTGQKLKIVYCYLSSLGDQMTFYPDDANVDIIGADVYDTTYGTTIPTGDALTRQARGNLDTLARYGALHGKPVALGEWGLWQAGTAGQTASHGGGDRPEFIDVVMDWAEQVQAVYLSYYDISDLGPGVTLTDCPNSLARMKQRYAAAG
jgi:hypothetical protein